jgi:nucleoid DNA-binding protein
MNRPVNKRAIFLHLAKKHGLTMKQVEEAVNSQFQFVREVMKSDSLESVRIPFFGRFWVKDKRRQFLQKYGIRASKDTNAEAED